MDVILTTELEQMIQTKVESGEYQSASEVVSEALRLMDEIERARKTQIQKLQTRLDHSLAQADRGELVDGEQFMQRMLDELDARRAREAQ